MAALLALQSLLHFVWLSSAPRSRMETKPAVPAMPHTQQRSVSSHISPGKLRPRMRPRGHSAGEKETAALAAAMWSAAPDRQRDYCSLFVLAMSRTKSEQNK